MERSYWAVDGNIFFSVDNLEGAEDGWKSELDGQCLMELVETIPHAQLDKDEFELKYKTIYQVTLINHLLET